MNGYISSKVGENTTAHSCHWPRFWYFAKLCPLFLCLFLKSWTLCRLYTNDFLHMMTLKISPVKRGAQAFSWAAGKKEKQRKKTKEMAKQYLRTLPRYNRQSFFAKFPELPFLAVLLLEKMLKFDPRKRISVVDALADPYFKSLHNINNEPVCMNLFNFDLEEYPLTVEQIKELIYHEALAFNPEPAAVESEALAFNPGPPTVED